MGVAFTALRSTAQVTKRNYEMQRLAYRKDGPMQLVLAGLFGGFVPQLTVWIAYTVLVSTLLGAAVVAIMKPKASAS